MRSIRAPLAPIYWCVLESCKWLALCNLGTKVCKTFLVRTGELFWCYSETSWISNNTIPFRRTEKQLVFWQLIFKTIGLLDTYLLSGLLYNWSFLQLVFLTTGLFDNWSFWQLVYMSTGLFWQRVKRPVVHLPPLDNWSSNAPKIVKVNFFFLLLCPRSYIAQRFMSSWTLRKVV